MNLFLLAALLILVYMVSIWLVSLVARDASIVDYLWGPGFVLVAWAGFFTQARPAPRHLLLTVLVTIWGLRLGIYLFRRNRGQGEDYRYAQWREQHGAQWWWRSFFQVNLLQGVVMWLVSAPLVATFQATQPADLTLVDTVGVIVWIIGFGFEAIGDWQLARFKTQPENQGRVLATGLWRYTRHPNYFGDATLWWGFYLIAVAAGAFWTIFSPVLMTLLLMRVSGVALLEKKLKDSKPQYQDYMRRTSAFFPWPPQK
jgi:steroid 5-alpha reductase family enzyme